MPARAAIREKAAALQALFQAAGAQVIEADILQPAETLLDLYGEDIRARAFVTHDPLAGERMLRPDFTVPVVQMHMQNGAEPARYTYSGVVFRQQEDGAGRASEYIQVGYEVFDRTDPPAADAEVFSLIFQALEGYRLRAATGDMGILMAAVRGLDTSDRRKAALLRHIWRPARFRALLDRYSGKLPVPESRARLLAEADPMARATPLIGLRRADEIAERIAALRADAHEPPIGAGETELLDRILGLAAKAPAALAALQEIARDMPSLSGSVATLAARLEALDGRGIDVEALDFEASYGRSSMEYYDGFVFGFYAEDRPDLPPVATGGRYDALTRVLGQGRSIPAVGGVIRPALLMECAP